MRTWVLCSPHSLGVVLSQGHGEYILLGNTSVEEGGSAPSTDGQCRGANGSSWDTEQDQLELELVRQAPGPGPENRLSEPGCGEDGVSGHRGCAAAASQPSKPTEPKTCHLHTARSWEALLGRRGGPPGDVFL